MSFHDHKYTVDELISVLQEYSARGKGAYTVAVEEYRIDDGAPSDDDSRVNDEYKIVYFSGTP